MGRKAKAEYVSLVLQELSSIEEPAVIRTKDLFTLLQAKGKLPADKWCYYNFSRAIRKSPLLDTTTRGKIQIAKKTMVVGPDKIEGPLDNTETPISPDEEFGTAIELAV